jgi:SAM-dependent methyltransferase
MVGQEYKGEIFRRGEPVEFLARVYTAAVWSGNPNSTCQIMRTLRQFPVTAKLPENLPQHYKMFIKAFAYSMTDKNTPLVGTLVSTILKLAVPYNYAPANVRGISTWWSQYTSENQFPNDVTLESVLSNPYGLISPDFNCDGFIDYLNNCKNLDDVANIPNFTHKEVQLVENVITNKDLVTIKPSKLADKEPLQPKVDNITLEDMYLTRIFNNPEIIKVLDIGCGNMRIRDMMFKHRADLLWFGYDIKPTHKDTLRDLKSIPNNFDLILFSSTIHHMKDEAIKAYSCLNQHVHDKTIVVVYDHDGGAKHFNRDEMKTVHNKYKDKSLTIYRSEKTITQLVNDLFLGLLKLKQTWYNIRQLNDPQARFLRVHTFTKTKELSNEEPEKQPEAEVNAGPIAETKAEVTPEQGNV